MIVSRAEFSLTDACIYTTEKKKKALILTSWHDLKQPVFDTKLMTKSWTNACTKLRLNTLKANNPTYSEASRRKTDYSINWDKPQTFHTKQKSKLGSDLHPHITEHHQHCKQEQHKLFLQHICWHCFFLKQTISNMGLHVQQGYSVTTSNSGKQNATPKVFPFNFRIQEFNLEAAIIKQHPEGTASCTSAAHSNQPQMTYLSFPLCFCQPHLPQHLRPLLHHKSSLISICWNITIMLQK